MPIDPQVLKRHKCSSGFYKPIFTAARSSWPAKTQKLVDLHSQRIKDGRTLNLKEWRAFAAIDYACELPFQQTIPTLLNHILSQRLSEQNTLEQLKIWGLSEEELFLKVPSPTTGETVLTFNPPVFYQIYVPLTLAYVKTVLAKIYNERDTSPLLSYAPLKRTTRNRVLSQIVTDLVNTTSTWYGYPALLRDAILQTLKYGVMLTFPKEEWHCEKQLVDNGEGEEKVTVKEGIRYDIPHPSRTGYDLMHTLPTINTDSGLSWLFHWRVMSYGEIIDNPKYWNRKNIYSGTNWFLSTFAGNYFNEFFPCTTKHPNSQFDPMKREDKASWYTTNDRDKAIFITEKYDKIIPKDWGLGDYPYPVWHHFTYAADDTPLWVSPMAYCPSWFMGYDYDSQAGRTSSLALETLPFQDHLGNILSQMLLTMKQNLLNVVFYDNQIVDKADIEKMQNSGEWRYRGMHFIGFDSVLRRTALTPQQNAFIPVNMQKVSIQEGLQMVSTLLNIMERVLQIAAQEVGAQATHQQSKEEVVRSGSASSNRINLTSSSVDDGIDAWKRQLFDANVAYRDPEIIAEVDAEIPDLERHLEELGFKIRHRGEEKVLVQGHKRALRLEGFASSNEGPLRQQDREVAQIIFQTVGTVAGQPDLAKAVGAKTLLRLLEEGAKMSGAPADFKLQLDQEAGKDQQVPDNVLAAIQNQAKALLQAVEEKVAKPSAAALHQESQRLDALEQAVEQLKGIYEIARQQQDKTQIKAQESQTKQQIKAAEAAAAEQRHQQEHAAKLQREQEAAQAKIALEAAQKQSQIELEQAESVARIAIKQQEAKAKPAKSEKTAAAKS